MYILLIPDGARVNQFEYYWHSSVQCSAGGYWSVSAHCWTSHSVEVERPSCCWWRFEELQRHEAIGLHRPGSKPLVDHSWFSRTHVQYTHVQPVALDTTSNCAPWSCSHHVIARCSHPQWKVTCGTYFANKPCLGCLTALE